MATTAKRWTLRVALLVAVCIVVFYLGRPLYWKLSASAHDYWLQNFATQQLLGACGVLFCWHLLSLSFLALFPGHGC
ncbi:hypothetical protein KP509_23G034500 [Ceratopteris richardii]|uniref:Uncharacterized protein n=1 Tax=Ceratopteris richardii TaxID=49495 RepID=A0A8T2RYU5_CERRI|nr:hypothetical protein KP509_23G034500 [Ceratopteris richardii]